MYFHSLLKLTVCFHVEKNLLHLLIIFSILWIETSLDYCIAESGVPLLALRFVCLKLLSLEMNDLGYEGADRLNIEWPEPFLQ